MHELSLVAELVQECRRRVGDTPVSLVRVRCAATVAEAAVHEAFRLLTADGPLSAARVEVEPLELPLRCPCGFGGPLRETEVVGHLTICPACGAVATHASTAGLQLLEVV